MHTIELIGSIDGNAHYRAECILRILSEDATLLAHGSEFVGRPNTRIYLGKDDVVKLRGELGFDRVKAVRWINASLRKEREMGVHHPYKTWFLIDAESSGNAGHTDILGNISPRLRPLHTLLAIPPESAAARAQYHGMLSAVFEKYLHLAKRMQLKLDEGLSDFGADAEGKIFYLDDEYYAWDNFVSFSVMPGVYIRTYSWLDPGVIGQAGRTLSDLIHTVFDDPHCNVVVAEQLRSTFMPSEEKSQLVQQLIDELLSFAKDAAGQRRNKRRVAELGSSRYFALLADIHANYPALERVLDYLQAQNIQEGIIWGISSVSVRTPSLASKGCRALPFTSSKAIMIMPPPSIKRRPDFRKRRKWSSIGRQSNYRKSIGNGCNIFRPCSKMKNGLPCTARRSIRHFFTDMFIR